MSVYVDDGAYRFRRMVMSHMVADTTDELHAMATKIGLSHRWLQNGGTAYEHFDVCKLFKARALANGAKPITERETVAIIRRKREAAHAAALATE